VSSFGKPIGVLPSMTLARCSPICKPFGILEL
jgi:hypothetical protein